MLISLNKCPANGQIKLKGKDAAETGKTHPMFTNNTTRGFLLHPSGINVKVAGVLLKEINRGVSKLIKLGNEVAHEKWTLFFSLAQLDEDRYWVKSHQHSFKKYFRDVYTRARIGRTQAYAYLKCCKKFRQLQTPLKILERISISKALVLLNYCELSIGGTLRQDVISYAIRPEITREQLTDAINSRRIGEIHGSVTTQIPLGCLVYENPKDGKIVSKFLDQFGSNKSKYVADLILRLAKKA